MAKTFVNRKPRKGEDFREWDVDQTAKLKDPKESWKAGNMLYPVPAVMVSCQRNAEERPNIITVAWAGTVSSDPAMVSISVRPERYSHDIIKESGEFVINLVTEQLTRTCDWCGVKSGRDVDKFKERKLTEYKSKFMDTPAIEESPINIYCKVVNLIHLGSHDMFLAKVVGVTASKEFIDQKGSFDFTAADLMTYSHGEYYALGKKLGKFGFSVRKKAPGTPKVANAKGTSAKAETGKYASAKNGAKGKTGAPAKKYSPVNRNANRKKNRNK